MKGSCSFRGGLLPAREGGSPPLNVLKEHDA